MPIVRIDLWKGREKETKRKLIKSVTSAVVDTIGCPPEAVHIIISEQPQENWGIGGEAASVKFPNK